MSTAANFLVYDSAGRILRVGYCPIDDVSLQAEANETVIQTDNPVDDLTHYVSDGVIAERTAMSASWDSTTVTADGTSEIVLSGLPEPCEVYIDGNAVSVNDGSLEFSTGSPGDYTVRVDEVAFLEEEWTVNAV